MNRLLEILKDEWMPDRQAITSVNPSDKYGDVGTPWMLEQYAKTLKQGGPRYSIPEVGAMMQREDFGLPYGVTGQYQTPERIMEAYPGIARSVAQKLAGAYIYPSEAFATNTPIRYLEGHEGAHELSYNPITRNFGQGIGNKGYFQSSNPSSNLSTTAGVEEWLARNYPPNQRDAERYAHIIGMANMAKRNRNK